MDLRKPGFHAYSEVFVVYGRKPQKDEIKSELLLQGAQLLSPPSSPSRSTPMTGVIYNTNEATKHTEVFTGESSSSSDESCSDMDSTWLRRRQKALIEHIMRTLCQHLDSKILQHGGGNGNGDPGNSSALQEGPSSGGASTGSDVPGMDRQRRERHIRGDGDGRGGDDDENDGDNRRRKSKIPTETAEERPKFACPYYKRNPGKYGKWTSCPGPGWDEVHRVK